MTDPARREAGRRGGEATAASHGRDFYEEIGHKGGKAAQKSGHAHRLTKDERKRGGMHSHGESIFDDLI